MSGAPDVREPGPLVLHGRSFPPGRKLVLAIVIFVSSRAARP